MPYSLSLKNIILYCCMGFLAGIGLNQQWESLIWFLILSITGLICIWIKQTRILLFLILSFWFGSYYLNFFKTNLINDIPYAQETEYKIEIIKPAWEAKNDLAIARLPNHKLIQFTDHTNREAGTILLGKGTIEPIKSGTDFDTQSYWLSKGVVGKLNWQSQPDVSGKQVGFFSIIENARKILLDKLYFVIKSPFNQLGQGLIMGFRADFDQNFNQNMKNTGTTHIVAISGYNISIIVAIFFFGLLFFGLNRAFYFSVVFIFLFICLVGFDPSVIRASILAFLLIGAKVLGRPIKIGYLLTLIATGMVLYNPLILLFNPSFQLSFGAVLGLVYLQPIIERNRFFAKLPRLIKESLGATLAAQLAVAPLLFSIFGGLSLISLLANLLILPLVPITMLFVTIVLFSSLISIQIGKLFGMGVELILVWMVNVINYLGSKFTLTTYEWTIWLSLIYYAILIVIVRINSKYEKDI